MNPTSPAPPRSPFATPLSGSAREAELRIRNIFQWNKKRPPVWLMALAGAVILLCGSLVSCQKRAQPAAEAELQLQLQYYDQLGNYVEVPALVFPQGGETEDARAVNGALSALAEEYRAAIEQLPQGQQGNWFRCLCYPARTDRYLSVVLYRYDQWAASGLIGASPALSAWVYDLEEGRPVSEEKAWALAGTSLEELRGQLEEEIAADPADSFPLAEVSLAGFRIGAENRVTLYLSSVHDTGHDVQLDRLYQWQDGSLSQCLVPELSGGQPLVPAGETLALSPALWCQWSAEGGQPERGWDPVPMSEAVQNYLLGRRTVDYYDSLTGVSEYRLLSHAQGARTLMLVETEGGPHPSGLNNLRLGVWDEGEQDFVGDSYLIGGDNGLYSAWEEEDALWLLCSNSTTYQGDETCSGLGLFCFAQGQLERVLELPRAALDSGVLPSAEEARYLLYPQDSSETGSLSCDFWFGRLAVPGEGGFDLYEKNPAYDPHHPTSTSPSQWLYRGFVPLSGREAEPLAGGDARVRSYYASLLEDVFQKRPLSGALGNLSADPDSPSSPSQLLENQFAVYDVDGDGREELLLSYHTTITAGQGTYVLDYRADTGALLLQSPDRFGLEPTFYENGAVLSPSSHNQGFGGRFWPYDVYRYESHGDGYTYAGSADAWDSEVSRQNPELPAFPEELDVSGSGFLYYLDGDETPVDEAVYLRWLEGHTGGTQPLPVQWFALTEQNILRLSG